MSAVCIECYKYLRNPYIAIVSARKSNLEEGLGVAICSKEHTEVLDAILKRKPTDVKGDLLLIVDQAFADETKDDGTISFTARDHRASRMGYMDIIDLKDRFPKVYRYIYRTERNATKVL